MSEHEYYRYEEVREMLKEIVSDEFGEKIECDRCRRSFDPEEEILYFVSSTKEEARENKGFFLCFKCRDHLDGIKMEQMI